MTPSTSGNILLVDDTVANLKVLTQTLIERGYKVRPATSGKLALKSVQSTLPDLILLDIQMPEMNGYEVCEKLKADDKTRDIPVIFISALDEVFDKVKAFTVGGVDYVTKPFQTEEVLARVETHLKMHRLQQQLAEQNEIITAENLRMRAELEVTRRIQQMILPTKTELEQVIGLDVAGFMEPADEVGGDYYDVLQHNGRIMFGIGDVTGHGLESGMLMLMVQMAVRTLLSHNIYEPSTLLTVINHALYGNVNRMNSEKNLSLSLMDYHQGVLTISGQHEYIIVVRNGKLEQIDTADLGFWIGLEPDIKDFVTQKQIVLNADDVVVLYTDGITEAENIDGELYELERLCEVISQNWQRSANEINQAIVEDVRQFIGEQTVFDDITLLVVKQK
ncbi:MAG: serine/threonine protein phosphatase [Candidatus Parabeggiatoa sp. nov. 1]|nr:MAG: serine/threonine protein phosphatase [Gammaproteobacteria bacterium]